MHKTSAVVMLNLFSVAAFAQAGDMGPPKPSEEIKALAKGMVGTLNCEGTATMGGNVMKMKYKATFTSELGGFFIKGKFTVGANVMAESMTWFDPATKMFKQVAFDGGGGSGSTTSKGFEGDVITWTGKWHMNGSETDVNQQITKKGPNEVQLHFTNGSGEHAEVSDQTCKK